MDAKFLELYNQELKFIRESGAEFAKEYPKIAGRLGLEGFDCADPYVERLLEGFAFLSARVHRKLDASFPEFTQHLLSLLFPTFLEPIPSMLIAQFNPDFDEGNLLNGVGVTTGTSLISQMGKDDQTPCEYRTAQDTTMWPVSISNAEYLNAQDVASISNGIGKSASAKGAIKLVLETPSGIHFSSLKMDKLSLHIRGSESFPFSIYEALYTQFSGLLYKTNDSLWRTSQSIVSIEPKGFNKNEALLPYCNRQFDGFRLLREYFAFPNRFLFLDINNIESSLTRCNNNKLELILLLEEGDSALENLVSKENFSLHSVPAINLFPKRAERIQVSRKNHEFHLVVDKLRPHDFEVCSVTSVKGIGNTVEVQHPFLPLYSRNHDSLHQASQTYSQRSTSFYTHKREVRTLSVKLTLIRQN